MLHPPGNYTKLRGFRREELPGHIRALRQVPMEADPGDVLVWSSLTVHGSEANTSNDSRMYYMNGFARARNCTPWPHYCQNGRIIDLDPSRIP
jgi:hypothetical protein